MTHAETAAYIIAQAALLNAEIAGMNAENEWRASVGQSLAYAEDSFAVATRKYESALGHNAVIILCQQAHD